MKRIIFIVLLIVLSLSSDVLSMDYYLRDNRNKKILVMEEDEASFKERIDFDESKKLFLCVKTNEPNKFLLLTDADDKKRRELKLVDATSGNIEYSVKLGYEPYKWSLSEDRNHFFITYRTVSGSGPYELLHFNMIERREEILDKFSEKAITDLQASWDGKKVMALTEINNEPQMIIFGVSPLKAEGYIPAGKHPLYIYSLSTSRVVILDVDNRKGNYHDNASVKLVDLETNKVIAECRCKESYYTYYEWRGKERALVLASKSEMRYQGDGLGEFIRVNENGIKKIDQPFGWFDVCYYPERDTLYVLTEGSLLGVDFTNDSVEKYKTGLNTFQLSNTLYFYYLKPIQNSDLLMLYGPVNGGLKFFNIISEKVVGKTTCGRKGKKKLDFDGAGIYANVNSDGTKYYTFSTVTGDITVLDDKFKAITYIVPEEPILGMYQITHPENKTIVVTGNKVYKIDEAKDVLVPIFKFEPTSTKSYFFEDQNRAFILHDQGILIINPANLEIKNFDYNQYSYIRGI